jgi:hypothetical protein
VSGREIILRLLRFLAAMKQLLVIGCWFVESTAWAGFIDSPSLRNDTVDSWGSYACAIALVSISVD